MSRSVVLLVVQQDDASGTEPLHARCILSSALSVVPARQFPSYLVMTDQSIAVPATTKSASQEPYRLVRPETSEPHRTGKALRASSVSPLSRDMLPAYFVPNCLVERFLRVV
jgi:hypothetical protein